jgi:hypothetical protein
MCLTLAAGFAVLAAPALARAASWESLSNRDTVSGLKEALTRGAEFAVAQLGKENGFLGNGKVKIPLPDSLQQIEGLARTFGYGDRADALIETMNRAAEKAVVEAKPLLVNAVKQMSVKDAKDILTGPQDAATQYFRGTTSTDLTQRFLPIVRKATARVKLAETYNSFASKASKFGLIDAKDANLDDYVTQKALDGLFLMIAEQEKQIRQDPVGTGSSLLKKVFGSLF